MPSWRRRKEDEVCVSIQNHCTVLPELICKETVAPADTEQGGSSQKHMIKRRGRVESRVRLSSEEIRSPSLAP